MAADDPAAPPADVAGFAERFAIEAAQVADRKGWEELRLTWLGRKHGIVRTLLEGLKGVPPAARRARACSATSPSA